MLRASFPSGCSFLVVPLAGRPFPLVVEALALPLELDRTAAGCARGGRPLRGLGGSGCYC